MARSRPTPKGHYFGPPEKARCDFSLMRRSRSELGARLPRSAEVVSRPLR